MTSREKQALLDAIKADTKKKKSKAVAIKELKEMGLLAKDGGLSPNYYPVN